MKKEDLIYVGLGVLSFLVAKHYLEAKEEKEAKSNALGRVKPLTTRQVFAKRFA